MWRVASRLGRHWARWRLVSSSAPWVRSICPGCPRSPAWTRSPGRPSTRRALAGGPGRRGDQVRAGGCRGQLPDRSRDRGRGGAPHHLPAHGTVDPSQPALPHPRAGGGCLGTAAPALYGRWYRFVMTFAGIAAGMEMYRIDPAHEDPTDQSINALNANGAMGWWPPCDPSSGTTRNCSRRSCPTTGHGQAHPAG